MRSKMFLISLVLLSAFATGCGGGGGGGGGGTTGATTTPVTLSGVAVAPDGNAGWAASIRAAAISLASTTAQAFKSSDNTSVSDAKEVNATTGAFSLSVTPAEGVYVKITNTKGLDLRSYIGTVAETKNVGNVNASSTVIAYLTAKGVSTADEYALATATAAINALFAAAPAAGKGLYDALDDSMKDTVSFISTAKSLITTRNSAVETALVAENLDAAVAYFSTSFTSTDESLKSTVNLTDFRTVTQSRFDRYKITSYSITVGSITFKSNTEAVVSVSGPVTATNDAGSETKVTLAPTAVTWKLEGGQWLIYADFPYRQEQIF